MTEERKRILVIEDEPAIRAICARVLGREGYDVSTAINGREGKTIAEKEIFSLYLIDIITPMMNGIEFYEWLRRTQPEQAGKVVFTTGNVSGDESIELARNTGKPVLLKPFTLDELKNMVERMIGEV